MQLRFVAVNSLFYIHAIGILDSMKAVTKRQVFSLVVSVKRLPFTVRFGKHTRSQEIELFMSMI